MIKKNKTKTQYNRVGGFLRVLRLLSPLKLVAIIELQKKSFIWHCPFCILYRLLDIFLLSAPFLSFTKLGANPRRIGDRLA
jgi:hypothetical protein